MKNTLVFPLKTLSENCSNIKDELESDDSLSMEKHCGSDIIRYIPQMHKTAGSDI
jgi:hypothetical protein